MLYSFKTNGRHWFKTTYFYSDAGFTQPFNYDYTGLILNETFIFFSFSRPVNSTKMSAFLLYRHASEQPSDKKRNQKVAATIWKHFFFVRILEIEGVRDNSQNIFNV